MKKSVSFLKTGLISGLFITAILVSCKKHKVQLMSDTPNLSGNNYEYLNVSIPGQNMNIGDMIRDGSNSAGISNKSVTLGRVLFYDKKLSINNSVSCGSCHQQSLAFSDNVNFSSGFGNLFTTRNSMSIQNPVFNNNMFWDSRARSPKELSMMPVFNHIEMGMETDEMLVKKLSETSYYPNLFQQAFGDEGITRERISLAISQFVNCLFSMNSKFDKAQADSFRSFTPMESFGMELFFSERLKCSQCHSGTNFSAPDFVGGGYGGGGSTGEDPRGTANIGLDLVYKDNGKGQGQFKIPSLRNIEFTGPYMHDGRFKTLEEVLEHYSHGIQNHPNLDSKFRSNGKPVKFNFSENEKYALISFLKTLTDYTLLSDPKFSDPFNTNN